MEDQNVRKVQDKILYTMKYIDKLCRENGIEYYIMGGTALGAIRHGGFIPWDDDLDIFMTPDEYAKFKKVFEAQNSEQFVLQEWRTTPNYLEYAKVRLNGTTFIEKHFMDRPKMHHGIYVDIMILHKVPDKKGVQKRVYYKSKFVTLYALSQRNWEPKSKGQKLALIALKFLPKRWLAKRFYKHIYKYDHMQEGFKYCYWITPAKFRNGLFDADFFSSPVDVPFEDTVLYGSKKIKEYLEYRYGDYMKLPPEEQRLAAVHAYIYDTEKDYTEFFNGKE